MNDNELYQKINAKRSVVRGMASKQLDLLAQAEELGAMIAKEEAALTDMKRELLRELKKELGS